MTWRKTAMAPCIISHLCWILYLDCYTCMPLFAVPSNVAWHCQESVPWECCLCKARPQKQRGFAACSQRQWCCADEVLMRRLRPEWDPSSSFFQIFKTSFGEQWYIPCKRSTLSFLWKWYSWRIEICCTHLLFPEKRVGTSPCLRKASLISGPRTPASFVQSLLVCCAGVSFLPRKWFLACFGFVVQADTVGAQRNLKSKLADRLPTL